MNFLKINLKIFEPQNWLMGVTFQIAQYMVFIEFLEF